MAEEFRTVYDLVGGPHDGGHVARPIGGIMKHTIYMPSTPWNRSEMIPWSTRRCRKHPTKYVLDEESSKFKFIRES